MKILIVTQYYWPENFRINDLSQALVDRGHDVTVYTGIPNYPQGHLYQGYTFLGPRRQKHNGIKIIRAPLIPRGRGSGIMLSLNYFSFVFFSTLLAPFFCRCKYDLIFVYEPSPITVGIPALFIKKMVCAPIIFWVQDLWPESLAATGAVKNRWLLDKVGKLVRFIYNGSDLILVTSRAFISSVSGRTNDTRKINYFPQYGEDVYQVVELPATAPERKLLPSGFIVMFAGNIGAAQDFQTILSAAEQLNAYPDIHFVVLGDGRMKTWVETEIHKKELSESVHLLGQYPIESMPRFFSLADAMLVTLKKDPIFALTVPAKIQSYMACGKPLIAALEGEGAKIIDESQAGVIAECENPASLAESILKLYRLSADERRKMGQNGRQYYDVNFSRGMLLDRLEGWMEHVVGLKKAGPFR